MGRKPGRREQASRQSGQSLAEFAIAFPVLFLFVAAIIQFGLIFWSQNTLTQVARDTGRWAATQQTRPCADGGVNLVAKANELARVSSLIGYTSGMWTGIDPGTGVGTPFPFDVAPAPREGIEATWPLSTDPPGSFVPADCPPDSIRSLGS